MTKSKTQTTARRIAALKDKIEALEEVLLATVDNVVPAAQRLDALEAIALLLAAHVANAALPPVQRVECAALRGPRGR